MEQRGKSTPVNSSTMSSRGGRVSSKATMESPKRMVSVSAVQSTPQSAVKRQSSRVSRSLTPVAPKKGRDGENVGVSSRMVNRGGLNLKQVSQRRSSGTGGTGSCSNVEDSNGVKSELQEKLCFAEDLIKDLQSQLVVLKEELQKSQSLNLELHSQNDLLVRDLAAAETKFANASNNNQRESIAEYSQRNAEDNQKLENRKSKSCRNVRELECKAPPRAPPPPPPPLPVRSLPRAVATQKSPDLIRLFHSLSKKEGKRDHPPLLGKPAAINAHTSIVGEIQNRSVHLLSIKADIETKGEFINGLIDKVLVAAYTDIEDVLKFVDWLDSQLSSLADERAVLKHFKWPEKKADAMREAAIEYRVLKLLETEIALYKDTNSPCEAALKKMASLLDKSERGIQRLIGLRNTVMHSYQDLKLPTSWMLDSGIMSKIKQASMNLAKMYMKRVKTELDSIRSLDKESNHESLLLQGVHFAYRTHQFAGGLDSETLCAFEEIKQWVPRQVLGESHSPGWIIGIPSS